MDHVDPLVFTILQALRSVSPSVAIQFLTGHTHIRAHTRLDQKASSFEAGHYADTLGFASFNTSTGGEMSFVGLPLEMNRESLAVHAGVALSHLSTASGRELSRRVLQTRENLGVTKKLGCSQSTFTLSAPLASHASIWELYMREVAPKEILVPPLNASQCFITSTGSLRYNLYKGAVTVDDVDMILPFSDELFVLRSVDGAVLAMALEKLNALTMQAMLAPRLRPLRAAESSFPNYMSAPAALQPNASYDVIVGHFDRSTVAAAVSRAAGHEILPARYTNASVAAGNFPPRTDTEAWMRWARKLPAPPCHQAVEALSA